MPLPARHAADRNWASVIGRVMEEYFEQSASIRIIDPKSATTTPYNATADTGGTATPVVIYTGKAIVQRVRRPAMGSNQSGWTTAQPYSFQLPATTPWVLVRKGMLIQVTDGGDDPALTELSFIVTVGLSGSWAPVRLFEATAEMVSTFPQSGLLAPLTEWAVDPMNDGYLVP